MEKTKRHLKITDLYVAQPKKVFKWEHSKPTIEETGKGDLLCYEAWGGRLFRSDEGAVREAVDKFVSDYATGCMRSAEDPANVYVEVYNFNDLYYLLGILPTHFGDAWGYSTAEDYAQDVRFSIDIVFPSENEIAGNFGEPLLVIEPDDDESYPQYYYREL